MALLRRALAALMGRVESFPPALLARFPELSGARLRRGGLPPRIGGWCLGCSTVAGITFRRTIWLAAGTPATAELLLHELRHVHHFQVVPAFPLRYVMESLRRGYHNNRFEVDARQFAAERAGPKRRLTERGRVDVVKHTATSVVTIERFIIEQEKLVPEATGQLSAILYDIALAAKMISSKVRRAGLVDILGAMDAENVQGEIQQKLDVFANETIIKAMDHTGRLCAMASEEEPDIIPIPDQFKCGSYVLLFDPLDGSSNIDVNVPVGTVFSIMRKITRGSRGEMEDMLQPGRRQVAAGYIIYGSSTMLVYTAGQGVHGFTLDPSIGEFLLSHPNIQIPRRGRYLSVNDAYEQYWTENVKALMRRYRGLDGQQKAMSVRYVGSLVADFHRNLLGGGVFVYPDNAQSPRGKLRLLYEANPLAMVVKEAGGAAYDGMKDILDVQPTELHQRTPLYIGSKDDIDTAREILSRELVEAGVA